jgi:hypothetical protein
MGQRTETMDISVREVIIDAFWGPDDPEEILKGVKRMVIL